MIMMDEDLTDNANEPIILYSGSSVIECDIFKVLADGECVGVVTSLPDAYEESLYINMFCEY